LSHFRPQAQFDRISSLRNGYQAATGGECHLESREEDEMYIGIGTILVILLIVILIALVF
jgi:hypothetical protein